MPLTPQESVALEAFKTRLFTQFAPQIIRLVIFGSRARGQGHEDSDVDVLVLVHERTLLLRDQISDIANDVLLEYEIDISPLVISQTQYQLLLDRERLIAREIERGFSTGSISKISPPTHRHPRPAAA